MGIKGPTLCIGQRATADATVSPTARGVRRVDHVSFPYRSFSHLTLLHVVSESGAWEKYGLEVEYNRYISSSEAHRSVPTGEVEFVGGNHISTYAHRAHGGDDWVYLGQSSNLADYQLVVRHDSEIDGVAGLRGKKVITRGAHPSLNHWLILKQRGLDIDRDDCELVNQLKYKRGELDSMNRDDPEALNMPTLSQLVQNREFDAAFVATPQGEFAKAAGLKVIDIEALPMIWHTTVSSSMSFVQKHPDIVERLLKGLIEGIHFFKTKPEETIDILTRLYTIEGRLTREQAAATYAIIAPTLEPKLFPAMAAIANVYAEAVRQDKDALKVNPMELWDMHHLRRIDDSGLVRQLYGNSLAQYTPKL
jgi:ABC-type nitrate/sulfonate/bicarbonate transport system substrate-binding protein